MTEGTNLIFLEGNIEARPSFPTVAINYILVPLILLILVTQLRHVKTKQVDYHADRIACFIARIDVDEQYHLSCAKQVCRIRQIELP